jgi:hypothetical protein
VQQLVVPLLNRWQAIGFVEQDVVPIMEALNNMSMGLGPAFEPYAQAVFEKGVMLLQLQQEARAAQVSSIPAGHDFVHTLVLVAAVRDVRVTITTLPATAPADTLQVAGQAVFEKGVMLLQLQQEARAAQVSCCRDCVIQCMR